MSVPAPEFVYLRQPHDGAEWSLLHNYLERLVEGAAKYVRADLAGKQMAGMEAQIAALTAERDQLRTSAERMRKALAELVAVKQLKADCEAKHEEFSRLTLGGDMKGGRTADSEAFALMAEYKRRQPLAWAEARAIISEKKE